MAPQTNLSDRLKAFADRFAALGRPSRPGGGYSGLAGGAGGGDGLGAPLVGGASSEGYYTAAHGVAPPPSRYTPPQTTSHHPQQAYGSLDATGAGDAGAGAAVNLPTQVSFFDASGAIIADGFFVGKRALSSFGSSWTPSWALLAPSSV